MLLDPISLALAILTRLILDVVAITVIHMERGSSAVECRTRNQGSRVRIPLCYRFEDWACINGYLTINSGGHVSDVVVARNCCMARMLPGGAELVSE